MAKQFMISRVVTRHFVSDFFQGIRNMFGLRLRSYEELMKTTHEEMIKEMNILYKGKVLWYRISFNQLGPNTMMMNLYGETR